MEIQVFSPDYVYLGVISQATSVMYIEKFQDKGTFEVYHPLLNDPEFLMMCQKENIFVFDTGAGIAGIVDRFKKESNDKGSKLLIQGDLCEEYIYRRICWGLYQKTGTAGAIIGDMIKTQVISPTDVTRSMPDIVLDAGYELLGRTTSFQSTGGNVGENVASLCQANDLGYKMSYTPAEKRLHFKVYQGSDRTQGQHVLPACVFSAEYDNLISSAYTNSNHDLKNVALVAGEGEGKARKTVTVGAASGKARRESFVDARDIQSDDGSGVITPEDVINSRLKQRGEEYLAPLRSVESFDCEVSPLGNIRYNEDYFLGDKVTIEDLELGLRVDACISEVEHAFDTHGEALHITFGFGPLTLSQKLKTKVV